MKQLFYIVLCLSFSMFIVGNDILTQAAHAQESREAITTTSRSEGNIPVSKEPMPRNEGETDEASDTDPVKDFLGPEIIQIISQPNSVGSFQVARELAELTVPKKNQLGGFPILKVGPKLNQEQIKQFQTLILDKGNYLFNVDKRCLFRPQAGLLFIKDKKEVEVLLSFSCASWLFAYDGERKNQDFDPVKKTLQNLVDALFPTSTKD